MTPWLQPNAPLKGPPICHAPPGPDVPDVTPLVDRILLCYATIRNPATPGYLQACGNFNLYPGAIPYTWQGISELARYQAQADVTYDPIAIELDIHLSLLDNGMSVTSHYWSDKTPRSVDPFDSGLLVADEPEPERQAHIQIME